MTRHIIFEHYHGGTWWKKVVDRLFCHLWEKVIDVKIGQTETHEITLVISRCVDCGILQLRICEEHMMEIGR